MEKAFWKRALLYFLIVAVATSLFGCKAAGGDETNGLSQASEMTNISTTAPTEPEPPKIVIKAPFDIYDYDPAPAKEVDLQITEGYQFLVRDERYYNGYRNALSNLYWCIMIVPVILEENLQDAQLEYEVRTNYGGLYTDRIRITEHFAGRTAKFVNEYMIWRGNDVLPEAYMQDEVPEHIWLDIVARKDGKVVGFSVYEIVLSTEEKGVLSSVYRYSEFYPTVEGDPEITEEFVNARIEACHQYFINNAE